MKFETYSRAHEIQGELEFWNDHLAQIAGYRKRYEKGKPKVDPVDDEEPEYDDDGEPIYRPKKKGEVKSSRKEVKEFQSPQPMMKLEQRLPIYGIVFDLDLNLDTYEEKVKSKIATLEQEFADL